MNLIPREIKKINAFIKQPAEYLQERLTAKDKVRIFLVAISYKALFTGMVLFIIYLVDRYLLVLRGPLLSMQLWVILLYAVIIAPLFEELVFRLPLRYDRNWLWRKIEGWFRLKPRIFWAKNYRYILYTFVAVFGLIHLSNYSNEEFLFYLMAPLIVGSQLFGGLLLSYTRLKLGFWWGVAQHGCWNGMIIMLSLLLFHNKEVLQINREDLALSIHELGYLDRSEQVFRVSQLENGTINGIELKNSSLQQIIDSLYADNHLAVLNDTWLNLKLKAPKGIDRAVLLDVLKKQYRIKPVSDKKPR
ncbi:CPBP family intramembrane metalloprotease [Olivibacter sp. SDN3]|uniref:CPBP family intramembrane glutamic endopeptidase n=1 Tax=Olivibacter sp. SDN3 TaxID=2764720 RepID=UPI001651564B|nr:CPBP family intramembrane glutamic endopeptidase [Olivibacter sp. SDN3]QNL47831.1 CPBP family intramembrane metalloprotease [Olivibacter sp. SDN3]